MLWALYGVTPEEADPEERLVLLVLADHAGHDGTGAYPSKKTISEATGLSRATVYRKCQSLQRKNLVRPGDQQLVMHFTPDRRPVVYDLAMTGSHAETPRGLPVRLRGVSTGSQTGSQAETQTKKPRTKSARATPRGQRCPNGAVIGADGACCEQCPPEAVAK